MHDADGVHREAPRAGRRPAGRDSFPSSISREVAKFDSPVADLPKSERLPPHQKVAVLHAAGRVYRAWREAAERSIDSGWRDIATLAEAPLETLFALSATRGCELIRDDRGRAVGALARREEALEGAVEIAAAPAGEGAFKISVRIFNRTPVTAAALDNQGAVIMRTFTSTHTILNVNGGEFISLMDPPSGQAAAAKTCKNIGTWPVLVGCKTDSDHDTLLSSPIILCDYPQIAPESQSDRRGNAGTDEIPGFDRLHAAN